MLKITIDNEEVLSNKNFTIEEEMLNTPSVVLDNVYPKSWENDKDYVNRFYHPNDYSKCLIKDEIYTPAEPGLNVEGTSFQITADTTKRYELTSMKGQTTQSGTPTPTTPVPVNVVSGRQDVVVCGKNLLTYAYDYGYSTTINGITWTINNDGTITANGTASSLSIFQFANANNLSSLIGKTIILNGTPSGINQEIYMGIYTSTYGVITNAYVGQDSSSVTINSTATRVLARVPSGATANNIVFKPMIRLATVSDNTYEAYKENTYNINLGKNLFVGKENYSQTINGVVFNIKESQLIINGTSTSTSQTNTQSAKFIIPYKVEPNTQYTYSVKVLSGNVSGTRFAMNLRASATASGTGIQFNTGNSLELINGDNSATFISNANANYLTGLQFIYSADINFDNLVLGIQLEKGSQATTYAPYKTPIELCKIGNYQDRIYKNGNKWYIEKKIGKVVLNGSETWNRASSSTTRSSYSTQIFTDRLTTSTTSEFYSSNFYYRGNAQGTDLGYAMSFGQNPYSRFLYIQVPLDVVGYNQIADFKTWLSTHNTIVYYVLATPTATEITDPELISQLESIELLEGLNNVSVVSPYLQGIINLHYNFQDDETTSNLLFCGVVKNSGNISLNPRYPHYQSLQILDFKTFLSEGETLDFVIANKTIEEAIDQIISTISPYGFVKGNIQIIGAGTIIGAYSTKDKTAYDVFNYLADITQSRWTTRMIDENTVAIDFYDPTLLPQGTPINYTATWFRDNLIDDMSYSYGSNDYRNKQVMTSNEVVGDLEQAQVLYANGFQTQFMTELKIAQLTEISVNGVPKTFATNDDKELGIETDFYYSVGNNIVESADTYSTGDEIVIRYLPIVEGRQIITNNDEIDRVSTATGRKGIVARYENRNDATTSTELQLIGQSYIKYKGTPEIKLTIVSRKNLWNIGDRVQFNAPIDELKTEYMVKKKTINRILANPSSEEHIVYTFEMTSSFNSEQAINYFDNQRAKAKGNIGQGDAISRNIDIEDTTEIIFYGSSIVEVSTTGDNVLNSTLNSPLNN